ncbi:hypothetical protein O181_077078, partial [Austropuccinia psidii MF-1]|nr:hypothetical protein [Austropuccinia psidii MF-1]
YGKTYAPTGRLNSLRALIAFAAVHSLQFHQIDVKSAFLNSPLTEEVFLNIPQGLDANKQTHCLKLNKAIYSLKQAPLAWYKCLNDWLISVKFEPCILDPCVFHRSLDPPIWLYLHVDDIGIFGKNVMLFKKEIATRFEIKDLGVRIEHGNNAITLDQHHFTKSLLNQYGMTDCKPASTPLVSNDHLSPATDKEKAKFEVLGVNFCNAVGSIDYLSSATQPDLSFSGTQDVGTTYHKGETSGIVSWSNADWGNCRATRRSVSGFLATFHGCLILWKTRKQSSVSTSTAEAKYKALCDLTSELLWLKQCIFVNVIHLQFLIFIRFTVSKSPIKNKDRWTAEISTMTEKKSETKEINIPILDGTNFSQWHICMKIHLRLKDLLDVCKKTLTEDAITTVRNKWNKASYEAISIITSSINERVFLEVINPKNTEHANLLWSKIKEQYASVRSVNRGRIWMDWQRCFYNGNLQSYIDTCRKLLLELESVSIKVPNALLLYSLLGKVAGDLKLHQFIESLTSNEELIEKPDPILTHLQDYVHLSLSELP